MLFGPSLPSAAALHLTNLYRNSLSSSQSSHRSGYIQALRDVLDVLLIQAAHQTQAQAFDQYEVRDSDIALDEHQRAAGMRVPSQKELRWLVRYLRGRIEAIKSDSDDEDVDAENDMPSQTTASQQMPSTAARQSTSLFSSDGARLTSQPVNVTGERALSATPSCSAEPDDHQSDLTRTPVSSAPSTPAMRMHRPTVASVSGSRSQRQRAPEDSVTSSTAASRSMGLSQHTPASVPTAAFSFTSPIENRGVGASPAAIRRKARLFPSTPSHDRSTRASNAGVAGGSSLMAASQGSQLSPVGEEQVSSRRGGAGSDNGMDEDEIREERGNGRRGPLSSRHDTIDRTKRRKRAARAGGTESNAGS